MRQKIEIDLARAEQLAADGLTREQIADALGISERTLYSRQNDSAEFAEAIKKGTAQGIHKVASALMQQIEQGNVTAMIFFLKTRAGWTEKQYLKLEQSETEAEHPSGLAAFYEKIEQDAYQHYCEKRYLEEHPEEAKV